jgi:hypothetical protein
MILNERQYMITKAQIKKFQSAVENLEKKVPPQDNKNEMIMLYRNSIKYKRGVW